MPYFQKWARAAGSTAAAMNVFIGEMGFPITSLVITAGVATIATREPHNLSTGQTITLQGASIGQQSDANISGQAVIATIPTPSSFTANVGGSDFDIAETFPQGAFVLPSSEPVACISEESGAGALRSSIIGSGGTAVFSGGMEILFENNVDADFANDPTRALAQARSEFGQLIQGIAQTQGTGDFICLNDVETVAGPMFTNSAEQDDNTVRFERWQALVKVTWGLTG